MSTTAKNKVKSLFLKFGIFRRFFGVFWWTKAIKCVSIVVYNQHMEAYVEDEVY